jgi:hypothetical protein
VCVQAFTLGAVLTPALASFFAPAAVAASAKDTVRARWAPAGSCWAGRQLGGPRRPGEERLRAVRLGGGRARAQRQQRPVRGCDAHSSSTPRAPLPPAFAARQVRWELDVVPVKPNFFLPSAETMGEWVVRAMGKGLSPVLTPHPGHALSAAVRAPLLSLTWPGCLRRAVARRLARAMGGGSDAQQQQAAVAAKQE